MSYYNIIDGNVTLCEHDIAEELHNELENKPFVKVILTGVKDFGIEMEFYDEKERRISIPYEPGVYGIYRKVEFGQYECLYFGSGRIYNRIYRFRKELSDRSRGDESHPGARKTRLYTNIRDDEPLYIRFMEKPERDSVVVDMLCNHLNLKNIDEHLAHIAHSRFNKKVKKA